MQFTDICIISQNVPSTARFYENIFAVKAKGGLIHSFVTVAGLNIAIYSKNAAETEMGFDFSNSGSGLFTIGFNVDDADTEYKRLNAIGLTGMTKPTRMPWGAKSFRFHDPDGNIIVFRSWETTDEDADQG